MEDSEKRIQDAMKLFPIEPFKYQRDPKSAMKACSFAIIGSSKSGKTTFLKYLLKDVFEEDIKIIHTQSPQAEIYNSLKKGAVFCPAYIPDIIKTTYLINKHTKNHYSFCHIIDDVVGVQHDKQMTKLLCSLRNSNISGICCGQDLTLLSSTGRANVNNICLFKQNTDNRVEDNIKNFLRSYFPRYLSLEEKITLYKRLTDDHCFLFINNLDDTITRCRLRPSEILD